MYIRTSFCLHKNNNIHTAKGLSVKTRFYLSLLYVRSKYVYSYVNGSKHYVITLHLHVLRFHLCYIPTFTILVRQNRNVECHVHWWRHPCRRWRIIPYLTCMGHSLKGQMITRHVKQSWASWAQRNNTLITYSTLRCQVLLKPIIIRL